MGLGHALLFVLGLRQEGRVVSEVLKIGMDQQPCGLNQLRNWLGQHSNPVNKRKTGRFIPGNPAISDHGDPWLSVPASRRVRLYLGVFVFTTMAV